MAWARGSGVARDAVSGLDLDADWEPAQDELQELGWGAVPVLVLV